MNTEFFSIKSQAEDWKKSMDEFYSAHTDGVYGYEYGDPCSEETITTVNSFNLGNYNTIRTKYLLPFIKEKNVLEIGCGGGKWTNLMTDANSVIAVDIFPSSHSYIHKLNNNKIQFYLNNGHDLKAIKNKSIDYVFSVDALVKSEKEIIKNYIFEISRVLTIGGKFCIHLPCDIKNLSCNLNFTRLKVKEIKEYCNYANITTDKFHIETATITHGILLLFGFDNDYVIKSPIQNEDGTFNVDA